MAENVQKSMENLSLHRQQGGYPSNNSNATQSPSLRAASATYNGSNNSNDSQSASARFERFFNSANNSGSPTMVDAQLSPNFQHHSPSSRGPGTSSSAAGLASSGAFGSFGHSFGAGGGSGAFNHSAFHNNNSSSTVPALRTKSSNIRQAIPSQWSAANNEDVALDGSSPPGTYGDRVPTNYFSSPSGFLGQGGGQMGAVADDDIIPTAIVVKNIPFSIKREQLLQIIEDLQIPMPYAFNYHFDQGVFRGLAFANFRSGEEADAVVAALNGFDVSGRKLRVEYKKVLQAGEKERIEKEKAIKRMQSMQMEKERDRMRRQTVSGGSDDWNAAPLPARPSEVDPGYVDYTMGGDMGGSSGGQAKLAAPEPQVEAASSALSDTASKKEELDLNDPATLEIYSRVLLFKDDRMRDELSFSKNLTTSERRIVHMVSKKLGLYHYSLGEGEERHVVVTKNEVNQGQGQKSLRSQASTIGRSHRGEGNGLMLPGSSHTTGRSGLRTKKSAPDMKRPRDRVDEAGFGGLSSNFVFGAGGSSHPNSVNSNFIGSNGAGLSRKSNGNLREGYSATMGRRPQPGGVGGAAGLQSLFSSPFDVPPVPSLPVNPPDSHSHSPLPSPIGGGNSNNGSLSAATSQHVLRQPAGPGGSSRNFAQRSRVPLINVGHQESNIDENNAGQDLNGYQDLDDRFGTLGNLNDEDVRTHEPLEV